MPNPGDLIDDLVGLIGDVLGASGLRLGVGPTLAVLGILFVFLQLVARPVSRWTTRDPGGLAGVGRAMALAAEAGSAAAVSLGSAGLSRSTRAVARLQTLAALPILGHVARAAARAGVPLRVSVNDPIATVAAVAALDAAHRRTATEERIGRSQVAFVGEGRAVAAGVALSQRDRPAAAFVVGGLAEEAVLLVEGLAADAGSSSAGTAEAAQAPAVLLGAVDALIGPELFQATADLRAGGSERTAAVAANRLIGIALAILALGSLLALIGLFDPRAFLLGAT